MPATPVDPRPLDILDGDFYVNDPYSRYAWLRENSPCHWDSINELWVITRYDDIVAVEKNKRLFISSDRDKGGYRPNIPADQSIIGRDDPLHQARRTLVSRRFTPRAVQQWRGHITETVDELLDPVIERGRAEIVDELAAPLPAKMIGLLLGFDDDLWPKLKHWSETSIATGGGPRYHTREGVEAVLEFAVACAELYTQKQGCPAGDVMSRWIEVETDSGAMVGGSEFGLDQMVSDCLLLLDGGAETTRTVIARTLLDLADRPDAWAALKGGSDLEIAVEEFIRWVTPIHNMCRTATADTDLQGPDDPQGPAGGDDVPGGQPRSPPFPRSRDLRRRPGAPTTTSPSASAPTSVSARRWPASRSRSSSSAFWSGWPASSASRAHPRWRCPTPSSTVCARPT